MLSQPETLVIFADASFRAPAAGCGFVAHHDGHLLLGARPLPSDTTTSVIAEERAAERALQACLQFFPAPTAIHFVLDSQVVAAAIDDGVPKPGAVARIQVVANYLRVPVRASWIKGHVESTRADHFANGVADRLSRIGRDGEPLTLLTRLEANWKETIVTYDARLDPRERKAVLSGKEAADRLGVEYAEVLEMVRRGDLPVDGMLGGIPKAFIDAMVAEGRLMEMSAVPAF